MPQQIDIPGQGIVEFPDGMDDEQIKQAAQKLSTPAAEPAPAAPDQPPSAMSPAEEKGAVVQAAQDHPAVENAVEALAGTASSLIPKTAGQLGEMAAGTFAPAVQAVRDIGTTGQSLYDVLFGGKSIEETNAANRPEAAALAEADKTPAFSKERFRAGFDVLAQMGMAAAVGKGLQPKPGLHEILSGEKPEPEIPTAATEATVKSPLVQQVNEGLAKGEINASEITSPESVTQPEVRPQVGESAPLRQQGETPEARQGTEAQPTQEVAPTEAPPTTEPKPAEPSIPDSPTSLKNAVVDQERQARGLPSAVQPAKQGFGELWDNVSKKIDENPGYPDEVIASLKEKPRAMTDQEDAALLHRQVDLQNQYAKSNDAVVAARASGNDAALAESSARSKALSDQLLEVYDIGKKGGSETGKGLNARKLLAQEDFSLANMITQTRAAKMGADLTPKEQARVEGQYNKIRDKQLAIDAYETSPRAEAYMRNLRARAQDYRDRVAAGDLAPKVRSSIPLPQEGEALKADLQRAKSDFQRAVVKDQAANRTPSQKFWDRFVGVERAFKLSSDVVLAKLTAAAAVREAGLTPAEEVIGAGVSKVLPRLAGRAPREGGFSLNAEVKAKTEMFTRGMKDAWQNLKMKNSDLDELYKTGKIARPQEFYDYMGYLHGALKAPIKRAEFARSLTKRMEWAVEHGQDVNNQGVMRQLSEQAYVDANRSIFLQDNVFSKMFTGALSMAERSKIAPNLGPAAARLGRFLVPIVKVPTNIVGEVATGVHGVATGGSRAAVAYMKGIEKLPLEQGDAIMRQLKKGLLGNALILTGYFLKDQIGGFFHSNDKRDKADVQPGRYRIGGFDLPASAGHSSGAMLLNIGATVGRVAEEQKKKSSPETKGMGEGALAAAKGLSHEIPFIPAVTGITDAMDSGGGFQKYINGMITSTAIPSLFSHIAKVVDTPGSFPQNAFDEANQRKPANPVDALKMGVPGFRQQVPEKETVKPKADARLRRR